MNDQNRQRNNNNQVRFNNPYNLDPTREDISIEKKINRDFFCPLLALTSEFGLENDYYSIRTVDPIKESLFHSMEALVFPNATPFQISSILCYIIIVVYIILLFFGINENNNAYFLKIKISTADNFGSFYPTKMKKNIFQYYRLKKITHLLFNIISLISLCSLFELLIKNINLY